MQVCSLCDAREFHEIGTALSLLRQRLQVAGRCFSAFHFPDKNLTDSSSLRPVSSSSNMEVPSETESEPEPQYSDYSSESSYSYYDDDASDKEITASAAGASKENNNNNNTGNSLTVEVPEQHVSGSQSTSDLLTPVKQPSHENGETFVCSAKDCHFRSKYKANLLRHAAGAHKEKGEAADTSDTPSSRTSELPKGTPVTKRGRNRKNKPVIRKTVTGKRMPASDKKKKVTGSKVVCRFPGCFKMLSNKDALGDHFIRVHTDKRDFPCPQPDCQYRGKLKDDVDKHCRRNHPQEKNVQEKKKQKLPADKCPYPGCNRSIAFHLKQAHE
jgi:hypothetical protein